MLSTSDIWLPRERDNVHTEIPQLVLCPWEGAPGEKLWAVLCTESNRQEKLSGALCSQSDGGESPSGMVGGQSCPASCCEDVLPLRACLTANW